jgi:hypothetical protein
MNSCSPNARCGSTLVSPDAVINAAESLMRRHPNTIGEIVDRFRVSEPELLALAMTTVWTFPNDGTSYAYWKCAILILIELICDREPEQAGEILGFLIDLDPDGCA